MTEAYGMGEVHSYNYANLQGWMVTELGLKGNELLIYAIIYGFTQEKSQWFVGSRQYLAEWTGATKQTVGNYLKSLVERGLLEKREKYVNGVKFCDYRVKNSPRVGEKFTQGVGEKITPINNNNKFNNISNIKTKEQIGMDIINVVWKDYPRKENKNGITKKAKEAIAKIGLEEMQRAVKRYDDATKDRDKKYKLMGSTFFNSRYVEYLDENWEQSHNDSTPNVGEIMTYSQRAESSEWQ